MNEKGSGKCLRQVEHRYSVAVNQLMVTTVKLSKWLIKLNQEEPLAQYLPIYFFFSSTDDFAPVLSLSQQNIFVLPIQLPAKITSKDDTELRQTLTTLRRAHMEKFVLHSMKRDVVKHVINAVISFHIVY